MPRFLSAGTRRFRARESARAVADRLVVEFLEARRYFVDIDVTTTADNPDPLDNFVSLREAVAAANVLPGPDRIILKGGEVYTLNTAPGRNTTLDGRRGYASQLTLTGDITFYSDGKPGGLFGVGPTVIDVKGNGRAFTVTGANTRVTFDGSALPSGSTLTIKNGVADQGGAMLVQDGATVTAINAGFYDNQAVGLSSLNFLGQVPLIAPPTVDAASGAVYVTGGATFSMQGGAFYGNAAKGNAGGYAPRAVGTGNLVPYAAGNARGGALAAVSGIISLSGVNFYTNAATGGDLAGFTGDSSETAGGNAFGGAVYFAGTASLATFTNNVVEANTVNGGGGTTVDTLAQGGGVYYRVAGGTLSVSGGAFKTNLANGGAGVVSSGSQDGHDAGGGALAMIDGTLATSGTVFFNNAANGGLAAQSSTKNNSTNAASGTNGDAYGGAIYARSLGTSTFVNTVFSRNGVTGSTTGNYNIAPKGEGRIGTGGSGGTVAGGALYLSPIAGATTISGSLFDTNVALAAAGGDGRGGYYNDYYDGAPGANGGNGGSAFGGAIAFANGAPETITNTTFRSNLVAAGRGGRGGEGVFGYDSGKAGGNGGNGGRGGDAAGGAIAYISGTTTSRQLLITGSTFAQNLVGAGDGGFAGYGALGGNAASGGSFGGFGGNAGNGGAGGNADGGAISISPTGINLVVQTTSLVANEARAGFGGDGGAAGTGNAGSAPVLNDHDYDTAGGRGGIGGAGGAGGAGRGGAISLAGGTLQIVSSTVADNNALSGKGGDGGIGGAGGPSIDDEDGSGGKGGNGGVGGSAFGGGIFSAGSVGLTSATIVRNHATGNTAGSGGSGGVAPGKANTYLPSTTASLSAGRAAVEIGGTTAVGGVLVSLTAASAISAIAGSGVVTFGVTGIATTTFSIAAGAGAAIAGGFLAVPLVVIGGALVGTYGTFAVLSSVSAIQALVSGGDPGSAFTSTFASLTQYDNSIAAGTGPNAAKLFVNYSARQNGYNGADGVGGTHGDGFGGGVYAGTSSIRNTIVSNNVGEVLGIVFGRDNGGIFLDITPVNGIIPTSLLPRGTPTTNDLVLNGGSTLASNGRNLFGVTPINRNNATLSASGDVLGVPASPLNLPLTANTFDSVLTTVATSYTTPSAVNKGENLNATTTDQLGTVRKSGSSEDIGAVEKLEIVYGTPATTTAIRVGSTAWTTAFKTALVAAGASDAVGVPVFQFTPDKTLPWTNLNQITVSFSRDVNVTSASLAAAGYGGAVSAFSYNAITFTATWTLRDPLKAGLDLYFEPASLQKATDLPLDPNFIIFRLPYLLPVKPGDADRGGTVTAADANAIKAKIGTSTTVRPALYGVFFDLDGDGKIAANDYALANARV